MASPREGSEKCAENLRSALKCCVVIAREATANPMATRIFRAPIRTKTANQQARAAKVMAHANPTSRQQLPVKKDKRSSESKLSRRTLLLQCLGGVKLEAVSDRFWVLAEHLLIPSNGLAENAQGPYHFTGTSDLVIAPRTAVKQDNIMLLSQLLVVIELKKPAGFQQGASQAYVELLCANVGRGFSPIVVLTDLGEQWAVMWVGADPDEPAQFAFYRADCSFAEAAHAVEVVCGQIAIDQGVTRQKRQAGEAPDYPLLQRKHFKPSTATVDAGDDERLYDVLSPEERHRVQLLEEAQVFYKRFREDYPMEFPKVGLSMFS